MKNIFIVILFLISVSARGAEVPDESLFQIDSEWTNQSGRTMKLTELRGHPVVIAMVYMTCPFLCPTITSDIQRIEKELPAKVKNNVRFVLISFDPDRDTPEKMQAFMKKRNLHPDRWILLTSAKPSALREIAGVLNFKFQKIEKGEFSHSYIISVLDPEGRIALRIEGANQDLKPVITYLSKP